MTFEELKPLLGVIGFILFLLYIAFATGEKQE